jgi:hypothetical protein
MHGHAHAGDGSGTTSSMLPAGFKRRRVRAYIKSIYYQLPDMKDRYRTLATSFSNTLYFLKGP